jgi:aconitate hydratase
MSSSNSFGTLSNLRVGDKNYRYFSLQSLSDRGVANASRLPYSLKILLENLLRFEDGGSVTREDIIALATSAAASQSEREIAFRPARVLMQDFTGVPAVVDLAAMRDALVRRGRDPALINPLTPVDLVIDHSVMVDRSADASVYRDEETRSPRWLKKLVQPMSW